MLEQEALLSVLTLMYHVGFAVRFRSEPNQVHPHETLSSMYFFTLCQTFAKCVLW